MGKGHFYFVGSMIDMFAEDIPSEWIIKVLEHCKKYNNKYLFQSKNPRRFEDFRCAFGKNEILGTTIESNYHYSEMGDTPNPLERAISIARLSSHTKTMVTIEPIMKFNVSSLSSLVLMCRPEWVNIGADSKGHDLPEPNSDDIIALVENLRYEGIEVKLKSNLKRLIKDKNYIAREFPR